MLNYDTSRLEKQCRDLVEMFKNELTWKWDDRFETVLAEFDVKDKDQVHANLKSIMGSIWDDKNAEESPEIVRLVIAYFEGIGPRQLLFTSDPDEDDIILCAWWPWGNDTTISIRIGVYATCLSNEENRELSSLFKGWFGL